MGSYTVGVAGQTVNLVASVSGGSTPSLPIKEIFSLLIIGIIYVVNMAHYIKTLIQSFSDPI